MGNCLGAQSILLQVLGQRSKGSEAVKKEGPARRAKCGFCPCCSRATHVLIPATYEQGQFGRRKTNRTAPWPLVPTRQRFTLIRSNIFPLDGTGLLPNTKFRYPRPWIRRPCAPRIHRRSRIPTWPWKMFVVIDRCRFPPPLYPRVGALSPRRRASPLHPFGLRAQWSIPNRPATHGHPARPEKPRGVAIGGFRAMASGVGKNDLKCALFSFGNGRDFGEW